MPTYEEVVRSREADGGFAVEKDSLCVRGAGVDDKCDFCMGSLTSGYLFFRERIDQSPAPVGRSGRTVCLDRVACRQRKTEREEKREADTEARKAAVAAAVILPEEKTFPENHD